MIQNNEIYINEVIKYAADSNLITKNNRLVEKYLKNNKKPDRMVMNVILEFINSCDQFYNNTKGINDD